MEHTTRPKYIQKNKTNSGNARNSENIQENVLEIYVEL